MQRVVEVLSSSGAVSPWFMAHMYEVMRAAPRTSTTIDRPLPLFGGDQVRREGESGGRGASREVCGVGLGMDRCKRAVWVCRGSGEGTKGCGLDGGRGEDIEGGGKRDRMMCIRGTRWRRGAEREQRGSALGAGSSYIGGDMDAGMPVSHPPSTRPCTRQVEQCCSPAVL